MDILDKLSDYEVWKEFLKYKTDGGHISKSELAELEKYINSFAFRDSAVYFQSGGFFSLPEAVQVNKSFSDKKRTVFKFNENDKYIQKLIAYLLYDFDGYFSSNLYSFRRNMGVKKAVKSLVFHKEIKNLYSYKLDISDYFNSVNPEYLLPELKELFKNEKRLYVLIEEMLTNPYAIKDSEQVRIKKGILAGSPLSGFLANVYLSELDKYFEMREILYARYSDDIIFFSDSVDELNKYIGYIHSFLSERGLSVNSSKESMTMPNEEWSFLGFRYNNGVIDISKASLNKLKKKMRRKARALNRWKIKNSAEKERAVRAFIKYFNKKLFSNPIVNEITWTRWYFPIINTDKSLKELDSYMQQCIRFIATSSQTKRKYTFSYNDMKELGYITLVNRYYEYKTDGVKYLQ